MNSTPIRFTREEWEGDKVPSTLQDREMATLRSRIVSLMFEMQKTLKDGFHYPLGLNPIFGNVFLTKQLALLNDLLNGLQSSKDLEQVTAKINNIFDKYVFLKGACSKAEINRIQDMAHLGREESVNQFQNELFPTLCHYRDTLGCSMEKALIVHDFVAAFNHSPIFSLKLIRCLKKDGLESDQIRDIACRVKASLSDWRKVLLESDQLSLLWKTGRYKDKATRQFQYTLDGTLFLLYNKANSCKDPVIGRGGFKKIVFARDLLRRKMMVRVSAEYSEQNLFEARLAILLSGQSHFLYTHPQSLLIYKSKKKQLRISYIQEYCNGGDLSESLNFEDAPIKYPPLEESEKYLIARSIIQAVDWLHQKRIIHRDIKPANILLVRHPTTHKVIRLALTDFGFACHLNDVDRRKESCLSPAYAPPELFLARSIRSYFLANRPSRDCWSVGVVLYDIFRTEIGGKGELSRHPPWYPIERLSTFRAFFKEYNENWIPFLKDPHPMTEVVRRLLKRDPEARSSLKEVLLDIDRILPVS